METVNPKNLAREIVAAKTVVALDENEQIKAVHQVLETNAKAVADYKAGKTGVIMFLVGQAMRELKGRGDATTVRNLLEKRLK